MDLFEKYYTKLEEQNGICKPLAKKKLIERFGDLRSLVKAWVIADGTQYLDEEDVTLRRAIKDLKNCLSSLTVKDKHTLAIGITEIQDDDTDGDWYVWCNPGPVEEYDGIELDRIGGNDEELIELVCEFYESLLERDAKAKPAKPAISDDWTSVNTDWALSEAAQNKAKKSALNEDGSSTVTSVS